MTRAASLRLDAFPDFRYSALRPATRIDLDAISRDSERVRALMEEPYGSSKSGNAHVFVSPASSSRGHELVAYRDRNSHRTPVSVTFHRNGRTAEKGRFFSRRSARRLRIGERGTTELLGACTGSRWRYIEHLSALGTGGLISRDRRD